MNIRGDTFLLKKYTYIAFLALLIALSACKSDKDIGKQEIEQHSEYMNSLDEKLAEESDEFNRYIDLLMDGKVLDALDVFENSYMTAAREFVDEFSDLEYTYEPLIEIVEHQQKGFSEQLDGHELLLENLHYIKKQVESDEFNDMELPHSIDEIVAKEEQSQQELTMSMEKMKTLMIEEFGAKEEEMNETSLPEQYSEEQLMELAAEYEDMISLFTDGLMNELGVDEQGEVGAATDIKDGDVTFDDVGHPHVLIEAKAKFSGDLTIVGKTNLPEGAVMRASSRVFGYGNPYIEGEAEVDANGKFKIDIQITEEEYTGDPIVLSVGYYPEPLSDLAEIYGEEGEYIDGPFMKKFTSSMQTRTGAIARAEMMLNDGESATFKPIPNDPPKDQGDFDVWIEPEFVKVHDDYYEIELKSNLSALTSIDIDIEIPDYTVAGYSAKGTTNDDGSIRLHVKRLEDKTVEKNEDVTFVVTATADGSLETINLYGTDGENFDGDLAEKTRKGKKIEYRFTLDEYKK